MKIDVEPGKYVVAVSGGVDSVVLLDLLVKQPGLQLVVAHFDHGMRVESGEDRQFVQALAKKYELPFAYAEGQLGTGTSEAVAREARYKFLRKVMRDTKSRGIITAHHEDDLLETAVINLLRGTGPKGLSSLKDTDDIFRPLLSIPKKEIITYAKQKKLEWHEDATNADTLYLRNYIRHKLLPRFDAVARNRFRTLIDSAHATNTAIDSLISGQLDIQSSHDILDRRWLIMLPHAVAKEVIATWLRLHGVREFDKKTIERIVVGGKTYVAGKSIDVNAALVIKVSKDGLALVSRER